jgi:ectoine hydroxylase-related dioxygenase (phytanoyl-CoA dioxygenase family)
MTESFFWQFGFEVFRNVVPKEIIYEIAGFLNERIEASVSAAKDEIGCSLDSNFVETIADISSGCRGGVESLTKSTRDTLTGHFPLDVRLSETLWKIPYSEPLRSIIKTILRSENIFMHMPPTARFVLPGNIYAGVPPHQDISYNKHMTDFVTVWTPLVDIDEECGGVTVYEGSGYDNEHPVESLSSEFWQRGVSVDAYKPNHCCMNAGDILILNKFIIHGSRFNQSNKTRISIDFRFFGEHARSNKHYLDIQQRKVFKDNN